MPFTRKQTLPLSERLVLKFDSWKIQLVVRSSIDAQGE